MVNASGADTGFGVATVRASPEHARPAGKRVAPKPVNVPAPGSDVAAMPLLMLM